MSKKGFGSIKLPKAGATSEFKEGFVLADLQIEPYRARLEIADGQEMKVDGCITARLKVEAIDKDLDIQPVPKLKAEMVIGRRSWKKNWCT